MPCKDEERDPKIVHQYKKPKVGLPCLHQFSNTTDLSSTRIPVAREITLKLLFVGPITIDNLAEAR
jgi:hypothetical protein